MARQEDHITLNSSIKGLLHDVRIGFEGGKCYHTDYICKNLTPFAVRKKIRRAFRCAQQWGEQFMAMILTSITFIRLTTLLTLIRFTLVSVTTVLDLDFYNAFVVDMDPQ